MAKTTDGSWRPDTPFLTSDGLKVTLRRAANLTPKGVLAVPFRFQTPPINDFRRPFPFNYSTLDTISGGQRARPMGAQLLQFSIDMMLMDRLAAEATSGVVVWDGVADPQRMINELRFVAGTDQARKGKSVPFRLTISQPAVWNAPVVNMVAVMTNIEAVQRAGHVATEFVTVTFQEFPEQEAGKQQRPQQQPTKRHTLQSGDTLHKLAIRFLHRASDWTLIAKANAITGVSANSAADLAAWAKKRHKKTLIIPEVVLIAREIGTPTFNVPALT